MKNGTRKFRLMILVAALSAAPGSLSAQTAESPATVTTAARDRVIDGILSALDRSYVFPEKATEMRKAITTRRGNREYASITSATEFATTLTRHLQDVSHDLHLRVRYGNPVTPAPSATVVDVPPIIGGAKILPGNIGYVEVGSFAASARAIAQVVAQQMSIVADAEALIIDIRRNKGGAPDAVRLVSSYLFGAAPVHLNSLYYRPNDSTEDFYTLGAVDGKRYGAEKPVYLLTSKTTFSAGEEFAYNLQSLKRATIIGETTGGGAHPGGPQQLSDGFSVFVPVGRAINPITKTNWEGVGVRPDIAVPADSALSTALARVGKWPA